MISEQNILSELRKVLSPDAMLDVVSLGLIQNLRVHNDEVSFDLEISLPDRPEKDKLVR